MRLLATETLSAIWMPARMAVILGRVQQHMVGSGTSGVTSGLDGDSD
jgi:hypothetical protein